MLHKTSSELVNDRVKCFVLFVDYVEGFREYVPIHSEEIACKTKLYPHPTNLLHIEDIDLSFYEEFILIWVLCTATLCIGLSYPRKDGSYVRT